MQMTNAITTNMVLINHHDIIRELAFEKVFLLIDQLNNPYIFFEW